MVVAEITVYGKKDEVLKQWSHQATTMALALYWAAMRSGEVANFCHENGGHFVDQHLFDPEQNERNR